MNDAEAAQRLRASGVAPADLEELIPLIEVMALAKDASALERGLTSLCPDEVAAHIAHDEDPGVRARRLQQLLTTLIALDQPKPGTT